MKKRDLKDYNRLLKMENDAVKYLLQEAEDSLSDGCRCGEIKLLQEENTELVKDLNDLQADWAESNVVYDLGMELAKLNELKEENYNLRKRLFDLEKQGVGDSESLQLFRAMEAME